MTAVCSRWRCGCDGGPVFPRVCGSDTPDAFICNYSVLKWKRVLCLIAAEDTSDTLHEVIHRLLDVHLVHTLAHYTVSLT